MRREDEKEDLVNSNELALQTASELEKELAHFRTEWKKELQLDKKTPLELSNVDSFGAQSAEKSSGQYKHKAQYSELPKRNNSSLNKNVTNSVISDKESQPELIDLIYEQPESNEQKAQYLFNKAVLLEQQARHYEGIQILAASTYSILLLETVAFFSLKQFNFIEWQCN
jgi:hypothetical protein